MRHAYYRILIALCIVWTSVSAETVDVNHIVKMAQSQQSKLLTEVKEAIFMAEAIYVEKDKDDSVKKEVLVQRRIHLNKQGQMDEEYIKIVVNGKELEGKEKEKAIKEWKRGARESKTKMPFSPEGQGLYDYRLVGSEVINGIPSWLINFTAKQKGEGLVNGKAYISKDGYNIVKMDFTPSNKPSVLKDINLSLDYSDIQGYWVPVTFKLNMEIEVKFVLNMFYRKIEIRDLYSHHKLVLDKQTKNY